MPSPIMTNKDRELCRRGARETAFEKMAEARAALVEAAGLLEISGQARTARSIDRVLNVLKKTTLKLLEASE